MEAPRDLHTSTSKLRMHLPRSLTPLNMIMPIETKALTTTTLHQAGLLGNILTLTAHQEVATGIIKAHGKTALHSTETVRSMGKRVKQEVEDNQCNSPILDH